MKKSLFLIMGSHLFPIHHLPSPKEKYLLIIEDFGLCTHFKYHKKKLVFFLEAMRNYADLLRDQGFSVIYIPLEERGEKKDFESVLKQQLTDFDLQTFESFEIEDRFFRNRLLKLTSDCHFRWIQHQSPMFFYSSDQLLNDFRSKKRPRLRPFYEAKRREKNILMNGKDPLGGIFSFDRENQKRLPKSILIPSLPPTKPTKHHHTVCRIVNQLFPDHPGETDDCWLPVSRDGAQTWLQSFLEERLIKFGPYEDAISTDHTFLFHSALSPLLNIGLLTPQEVIEKALEQKEIPINSIEGFVRQILGWREFIRGIDESFGLEQEKKNFFSHKRKLGSDWWIGETGLLPVDHIIRSLLKYGYCHHIERLMVLSNVMLLLEIDPKEVYRWFMEMFVDSADWVMGPNVYGMGQFSDGGLFATKPYICSSNYIKKMSNFPKGDWCDIFDGLYWRFIDKQRKFFSRQPRLNMMLVMLDRMPNERRLQIFSAAEKFQEKVTK